MTRRQRRRPPQIPVEPPSRRYLLDQFSQADITTWRKQADAELEYANAVYFHLEAQRGVNADAIRASLTSTKPFSLNVDGWMRIIDYRYSLEPPSAVGSLKKSGRFNIGTDVDPNRFPPFPALYLAEDYETAFAEKFGTPTTVPNDSMSGTEFSLRSPTSFTSVRLSGHLRQLFDLTEGSNLRRFVKIIAAFRMTDELLALAREARIPRPYLVDGVRQLKAQLLANDWRRNPIQFGLPSNPQVFARLVREAGFEGIFFQSVRGPGRCIALNMMRVELAAEVERFVERKGFTQAQAARFFGVTQPKISKILRGRLDGFTIDYLVRMASLAGCNPRVTFGATARRSGMPARPAA